MNKALIAVAICVWVLLVAAGWSLNSDLNEWRQVDLDLSRVVSSIDGESMASIRSHVADLDSKVRVFERRSRFVPLDNEKRIKAAHEGIALFYKTDDLDDENVDMVLLQALPPESTAYIRRKCWNASGMAIASYREYMTLYAETELLSSAHFHLAVDKRPYTEDTLPRLEREGDISKRLGAKASEYLKLARTENQRDVRIAYVAVAKNKFLLALNGREQGPGWVKPPFPVYDASKEDSTCWP